MRNKQPQIKAIRIQLPPFIQRAVAHTISHSEVDEWAGDEC
jgi:hypothetical protein